MHNGLLIFVSIFLSVSAFADLSEPQTLARIACQNVDINGSAQEGFAIFDQIPTPNTFGTETLVLDGTEFIAFDQKYKNKTYSSVFRARYYPEKKINEKLSDVIVAKVAEEETPHDYEGEMKKLDDRFKFVQSVQKIKLLYSSKEPEFTSIKWPGIDPGGRYSCIDFTISNPNYRAIQTPTPSATGSIAGDSSHQDANARDYNSSETLNEI